MPGLGIQNDPALYSDIPGGKTAINTLPHDVPTTEDLNLRSIEATLTVTITLDLNTILGRNATRYQIINDGAGSFTFATSLNGSTFESTNAEITLNLNEEHSDIDTSVDSIRLTWSANADYRVLFR